MLCSRFLRPPGAGAHGRLYRLSERVFDGMLRVYDRSLQRVLQPPRATIAGRRWPCSLLHGLALHRSCPRGSSPARTSAQIFGFTEAAQGISFDAMVAHQQALAEIVAQDPNVESFMSSVGAGGQRVAATPAACSSASSPATERPAERRRDHPAAAAQAGRSARDPGLPAEPAADPHRRPADQEPVPVHPPEPGHRRALPLRRRCSKARCAQLPGLQDVTSDLQIKNPQVNVEIDRDKASALGVTAAADRRRPLQRLRLAAGLHHLRPQQPVPGDPGAGAAIPARPRRPAAALRPLRHRRSWCRWTPWPRLTATLGPLSVNHLGPAPGGDALLQPQARASPWATRWTQVEQAGPRDAARHHHHQLPGHGPGLPVLDPGPGAPAAHGHPGHLHRAGHPLRELHPPADDPLRPALRRLRRAAHAAALRHAT